MKICFMCLVLALSSYLSAQNVGIGTSNPVSKLSISGNTSIGVAYIGTSAPDNGLIIQGQTVTGSNAPLYPNDQFSSFAFGQSFSSSAYLINGVSGGLNAIASCALYAQVSGGGGLGLLVDHYATADIALLSNVQSPYAMMAIKGDAGVDGPHGVYGEQPIGSFISYSMYANGDLYVAGGVFGPSDKQLKENIQQYNDGLSTIMQLKPVSYAYKAELSKKFGFPLGTQVGFLAQDIEKVLPESTRSGRLVSKAKQTKEGGACAETMDNVKGVNYLSLIPVLTQAIQQQQQQITAQSSKIEALKTVLAKFQK